MSEMTSGKKYTGRTVLYTTEKVIDETNVLSVLQSVLAAFNKNKAEIDYLYKYYRGDQPILNRVKKIRPEINNRVVENHAHEIVSFKKGYDFGEPVQYVRRAIKSGTKLQSNLSVPNAHDDMKITSKITLLNTCLSRTNRQKTGNLLNGFSYPALPTEWCCRQMTRTAIALLKLIRLIPGIPRLYITTDLVKSRLCRFRK